MTQLETNLGTNSGHSILGASSFDRRMQCPGSALLEQQSPRSKDTQYAAEGTAAHELAAWCLEHGKGPAERLGDTITVGEFSITVTMEMADAVQDYIDRTRGHLTDGDILLVEQTLDIGWLVGIEGDTSTADAVVLRPTARQLIVRDLKYGKGVRVDANDTVQPIMYGIAALRQFDALLSADDIDEIIVEIDQPRIEKGVTTLTLAMSDVAHWTVRITSAADLCHEASVSELTNDEWEERYLSPEEDACRFCKAKARCPALAKYVEHNMAMKFDDLAEMAKQPPKEAKKGIGQHAVLATPEQLAQRRAAVDLIEDWCNAVREESLRLLEHGVALPGFRLGVGKAGARKWADNAAAEEALRSLRLKVDEMYDKTIKSPTAIEKLLAKEHPRQWAKLEPLVVKSEGKPTVVREDSSAPAVKTIAEQFDLVDAAIADITNEDDSLV